MAGRRWRELGAGAVLPRRSDPAGLSTRGSGPHRTREEMDRLYVVQSASGRGDRSCEGYRLVAEVRDAEGAYAVPGGIRGPARHPADGALLRVPGRAARSESVARVGDMSLAGRGPVCHMALQSKWRFQAPGPHPQAT